MQLLAVEPAVAKYFPATHTAHDDAPVAVWYCPAAQFKHVLIELDPVEAKNVPAAQLRQTDAPGADWYWPAAQLAHDTPVPP